MVKRVTTSSSFFGLAMAPFALAAAMLELGCDSQRVIAMRTAGMMGLWNTPSDESTRMVSEKSQAAALSARALGAAIARGETPDRVLEAALRPIQRKARANARRLTKRGPTT